MNKKPSFEIENSYIAQYAIIAGADEVGRGAIAGPIVAAAVVFDKYDKVIKKLLDIRDSKILTPTKRLEQSLLIKSAAKDYSIGLVEVSEIDQYGIGAANILAFKRAAEGLKKCDFLLIDGRKFHGFDYSYACFEKGESKSISIAAASILAKVYRDSLMQEIHNSVYRYDFASNKGYGSKLHYEAIKKYGISKFHRKSFLKKLSEMEEQEKLF